MLLRDVIPVIGFLTDGQMRTALTRGLLLEQDTWDDSQVRHASYTLRLGDRVEVARATDPERRWTVYRLGPGLTVDLHPFDTALLYSREQLNLPDDVAAFTVARGLLYTESLTPENTYADPGFHDRLYTTVVNVSNRVVTLSYEMGIARLFFCGLSQPVGQSYRTGSSQGIAQQMMNVPSRLAAIPNSEASQDELLSVVRSIPLAGPHLVELFRRERRLSNSRLVMVGTAAFLWPVLSYFGLNVKWVTDNMSNFVVGTFGSLFAALIGFVVGRIYRKFPR